MTHEKHLIETYGKPHAVAILIAELFENLLDEHNIYVPDEDRTGEEGEACLYGTTYYNLVDDIDEILAKYIEV